VVVAQLDKDKDNGNCKRQETDTRNTKLKYELLQITKKETRKVEFNSNGLLEWS
jgi:hypothetical protein